MDVVIGLAEGGHCGRRALDPGRVDSTAGVADVAAQIVLGGAGEGMNVGEAGHPVGLNTVAGSAVAAVDVVGAQT